MCLQVQYLTSFTIDTSSSGNRIGFQQLTKRINHRFIVKPRWFGDNEFPRLRYDISTIRHALSAWSRLYFRLGPFDDPLAGYQSCYLKMDLILINNHRRIIILKFFELFYIPYVPLRYVLPCWERSAGEPVKNLKCGTVSGIAGHITLRGGLHAEPAV